MSGYHIVDEPHPRFYQSFITNPIAILFVAILLPIFITLPHQGRIWMPLVWIALNGYLLGSPTLKQEILICIVGGLVWFSFPYVVFFSLGAIGLAEYFEQAVPYVRLTNQGFFFLTLYLAIFKQSIPYEIYSYIKENQ